MRKLFEKIAGWLSGIGVDKWIHFDAVLFISFIIAKILKLCGTDTATAMMAGFTVGVIAGFAKEIWDRNSGGKFDWQDIKADVYGATAGALMGTI